MLRVWRLGLKTFLFIIGRFRTQSRPNLDSERVFEPLFKHCALVKETLTFGISALDLKFSLYDAAASYT